MNIALRTLAKPGICGGRAVIAGARVRVSDIIKMLAGGADTATILSDYPYVNSIDVQTEVEVAECRIL